MSNWFHACADNLLETKRNLTDNRLHSRSFPINDDITTYTTSRFDTTMRTNLYTGFWLTRSAVKCLSSHILVLCVHGISQSVLLRSPPPAYDPTLSHAPSPSKSSHVVTPHSTPCLDSSALFFSPLLFKHASRRTRPANYLCIYPHFHIPSCSHLDWTHTYTV